MESDGITTGSPANHPIMLEARHISKHFGGVKALADISLRLEPGKVTAIIGENGAGKSTLMKIFSGVHNRYEGQILCNGQPVQFSGTRDAEAAGIAIIHQELNLVPHLTIAENIFLGREITNSLGILDKKKMNEIAGQLLKRLHLSVAPDTKIAAIKVGQQQLVEIARALHSNASVIIMDEPTSAISDQEAELLFSIIEELKKEGKTIAYISHKFKEIFAVADRYVVLRDGHTVDEGEMKDATQESLIRKMTGRDIAARTSFTKSGEAPTLLSVKNLCLQQGNKKRLDHLSFELKEGEILGIYGLMGAGRTELLETIFGLHAATMSADITVKGKKYIIRQPADAIKAGIALVPEDRKLQGLVLNQSVNKNIGITILQLLERWGLVLDRKKEEALSAGYISSLRIKTPSAQAAVQNLSGGNQQKIVIAKWLATKPAVLLLDEPTRGIDINAKSEIYELMRSLAAEGMGIIMVSSEMPEILALADRILVMNDGRITANLPAATATEQDILSYAIQKTELHT